MAIYKLGSDILKIGSDIAAHADCCPVVLGFRDYDGTADRFGKSASDFAPTTGDFSWNTWVDSAVTASTVTSRGSVSTGGNNFGVRFMLLAGGLRFNRQEGNNTDHTLNGGTVGSGLVMVTCTYAASDGDANIYVNASSAGNATFGTGSISYSGSFDDGFYVGTSNFGSGNFENFFDGNMGYTAIYTSKELTTTEITALFNSGCPIPYADMTAGQKTGLGFFYNGDEASAGDDLVDDHSTNDLTDSGTVGVANVTCPCP